MRMVMTASVMGSVPVGSLPLAEVAGLSRGWSPFSTTGHGLAKVSRAVLSTGRQPTVTGSLAWPGKPQAGA
jgi:hypothetical protein